MAQTPAELWAGRAGRVDFGAGLLGPSRAPGRAGARGAGRVPAPCAGPAAPRWASRAGRVDFGVGLLGPCLAV